MNTELRHHSAAVADRNENSRAEAALSGLPTDLQQLNRIYLTNVQQRSLLSASEAATWHGHAVTVFLRHDKVSVFSIVYEQSVAMADFVTLDDVTFHVSQAGRAQSNAGHGPLPNTRTVHAYLTGSLRLMSDHGSMPDPALWEPIWYHPTRYTSFVRQESEQPIATSHCVELVPGRLKVWCPRADSAGLSADSGGHVP